MKRAPFWFLVGGLLLVMAEDIRYRRGLQQHYDRRADVSLSQQFVSATRGAQKKIVLPDGSVVWLNAASMLSYPASMSAGDRTVELYGEAFFDVAAVPAHPFIVRARDLSVEVLGTRFTVRNYPEELHLQTQVVAGAIRVTYHSQSAVLHRGEAVDINAAQLADHPFLFERNIDTTSVAGWTRGMLSFSDVDLRTLLQDLSRAYNVDIQLNGNVSDHRFRGTLSLQEPLEEVIDRLVVPYTHVTIDRPTQQRLVITVNG